MRGPLTRIRERREYAADPLGLLAEELRDEPATPSPTTIDVDAALDGIDQRDRWLEELVDDVLPFNDDTGAWEAFTIGDLAPEPDVIPAGAVHTDQDVYADGRRCGGCGVPAVNDLCIRCTTEAK